MVFAKANIVGDQQVDPRHGERPDHRVKLVFIDLDAAAERGLQGAVVSLGNGAPAHGIQKGLQALGMVERNLAPAASISRGPWCRVQSPR